MAEESHFKLKAVIDGQEVVGDRLDNLQGNQTINVFPTSKNNSNTPIKGSASIHLLTKIYNVSLTHKGKEGEDPDPSSYTWSYIAPLYSIGDTRVSEETKKVQDTAYVRFSCGKTETISGNTYIREVISKPYSTLAGLEETVGDFSKEHYGREINSTTLIDLIWFKMYYKNIEYDGVVPTDDDTPESNKSRIPCRPDVSAVPDWVTEPKLNYHIWTYSDLEHTHGNYFDFDTWEEFINYWDNNVYLNPNVVDASFSYILWAKVQPNNLTSGRSGTITFNEISDGKGSGIHGAEPLYLKISQQEGFINYHLSSISVPLTAFSNVGSEGLGRYNIGDITTTELYEHTLPETEDDIYGHYCIYTPEFKIRSSIDAGRGAPAKLWQRDGIVSSLPTKSDGFIIYYEYIGKPVIFGIYKEMPSVMETSYIKPYGDDEDNRYIAGSWLSKSTSNLLGNTLLDPIQLTFMWHTGTPPTSGRLGWRNPSHTNTYHYPWGVINGKHWMFKLMPLCIKTLGSLGQISGQGLANEVNEVEYYNNGDGAVTSEDVVNRGIYSKHYWEYIPSTDTIDHTGDVEATKNSIATLMGRYWLGANQTESLANQLHEISQVMFLPVLFTDFYLENENPFENSEDAIGRLYFSPGEVDESSVDSKLHQLVINRPLITRI